MASSLIDGRWDYGASDAAIFAIPEDIGFGAVMDAAQIDALVHILGFPRTAPDAGSRARTIPLIPHRLPLRIQNVSTALVFIG